MLDIREKYFFTRGEIVSALEMILFFISIFLQDFAIVKIGSSGISPVFAMCLIISLRHKLYKDTSLKLYFIVLIKIFLDIVIFGYIPIQSIIRVTMIIFILESSYKYTKLIYINYKKFRFEKIFSILLILIFCYGLYSMIAYKLELPLFLNVFRNNPSYFVGTDINDYYSGGWVGSMRVFATFAEPSMFAYFIIISIMLIYNTELNSKIKSIIYILGAVNLVNTFARSGYVIVFYIAIIITIYMVIEKVFAREKAYKYIQSVIISVPFINILIMYIANRFIFNDLSSDARTSSALYYLSKSFESIKAFLFGHGYKSIQLNYTPELLSQSVEAFPHNGFIEIIYEFGWVYFALMVLILVYFISSIQDIRKRIVILSMIIPALSFTSFFNIETMMAMYGIFTANYIFSENNNMDKLFDKSYYSIFFSEIITKLKLKKECSDL